MTKSLKNAVMMMTAAMLAIVATTAGAAEPRGDAAALENSRQNLAWQAQNAKGVDSTALRAEEQRLQDLIDDLQRGERVDPSEVDRILNRTR